MRSTLPPVDSCPISTFDGTKVFVLDMDGTIYLDTTWIDGAKNFLDRIKRSGRRFILLTNNSSKDPSSYISKLHTMGYAIGDEEIITSGQAATWYLNKHYQNKRVFLLGNQLLKNEFLASGIVLDDMNPEVVVIGFDTELTYSSMTKACDFVRSGLPYIATHPDLNCPTSSGFIPDAGAIMAFVQASSNRTPDTVIGKPNTPITDYLMERLVELGFESIQRGEIAMVGDRLYTDIAAGNNAGFVSVLVLSGESTLDDAQSSPYLPNHVFTSVKEIPLSM
ncbi:HAD-IIA family hydrolase [Olsenella massiliensis]|uniref:HAD-IIA family hydrolase n=1 Tax=Olsenella massiliensis TaxID=1622075 RepID=UPI000AD466DB|nr:HAD-IIA family hydrolase [Olsenella massiliensis]